MDGSGYKYCWLLVFVIKDYLLFSYSSPSSFLFSLLIVFSVFVVCLYFFHLSPPSSSNEDESSASMVEVAVRLNSSPASEPERVPLVNLEDGNPPMPRLEKGKETRND